MSGQTRLTVYYDGACPVCSREMGFYQRQAGADDISGSMWRRAIPACWRRSLTETARSRACMSAVRTASWWTGRQPSPRSGETCRGFQCWGLSRHGGLSASPSSWAMAHSCGCVAPGGDDGAPVIAARSALI